MLSCMQTRSLFCMFTNLACSPQTTQDHSACQHKHTTYLLYADFLLAVQPPAPSQKAETSGEGREAAPQQAAQPKGPRQPWWTGVMDRRFVGSFEPLAAWLKAQTRAGGMQPVDVLMANIVRCRLCTEPSCAIWLCRHCSSTRWGQSHSNWPCACPDDLQHLLHTQHATWHSCLASFMHR